MAYINDTNLWPISGYNYSKFNALLKHSGYINTVFFLKLDCNQIILTAL